MPQVPQVIPKHAHFNVTGWLGYALFAAIGTTLFIYTFLPYNNCYVTPTFCLSMYGVYHAPLGIAGYSIFSHLVGVRNIKIYMILLLLMGLFAAVPAPVHAQPLAFFDVPQDYYPFTYWVDSPLNVSYSTVLLGSEFLVYEWTFFWPYHPVSFPSTCGGTLPTNDWELVYVYVSFATQGVAGIAYRFHCNWTFKSAVDPGGIVSIVPTGVTALPIQNATRPVITFISRFHIPDNDVPGSPSFKTFITNCLPDCAGSFAYIQQDYNYTQTSAPNINAHAIPPDFFRGTQWVNVEYFTIGGFLIWGGFVVVFGFERRYLAGSQPVKRK